MNSVLMGEILEAITQSEDWEDVQQNDPLIQKANAGFEAAIQEAKKYLPIDVFLKVNDAWGTSIKEHGDAGILFGLRVADTIREMAAHPEKIQRGGAQQ